MSYIRGLFENNRYNDLSGMVSATMVGTLTGTVVGRIKKPSVDAYVKASIDISKNNLELQKNTLENAYEILKTNSPLPVRLGERISDLDVSPTLKDVAYRIKVTNKKLGYLSSPTNLPKIEWNLRNKYNNLDKLPETVAKKVHAVLTKLRKGTMIKLAILGAFVGAVSYKFFIEKNK